MEASIIFHFAGRGSGAQRLALIDFAQLLNPRWRAPHEVDITPAQKESALQAIGHSAYSFIQGGTLYFLLDFSYIHLLGIAGASGATIVYPIDLGKYGLAFRSALTLFQLRYWPSFYPKLLSNWHLHLFSRHGKFVQTQH